MRGQYAVKKPTHGATDSEREHVLSNRRVRKGWVLVAWNDSFGEGGDSHRAGHDIETEAKVKVLPRSVGLAVIPVLRCSNTTDEMRCRAFVP